LLTKKDAKPLVNKMDSLSPRMWPWD
jgi:hypothetical protein